jgi:hypothetical protein
MKIEEIKEQLNLLSEIAKERMITCTILTGYYMSEIDFLTAEEREIRHQLMLLLPTFFEERMLAKERIKERVAKRKTIKNNHSNSTSHIVGR